MTCCLLALGSNLGDRRAILARACAEISALPDSQLLARSSWHSTSPIGGAEGQDAFLNGALLIETAVPPAELAAALQAIETKLGRARIVRWDARPIDIDMLLYGDATIETADLTVPHPRMTFRRFVLEPAVEVAGEMLHPTSGWTIAALLAHLQRSPSFIAVTAREPLIAKWLVTHLQQSLGCRIWSQDDGKMAADGVSWPEVGVELLASDNNLPPFVANWGVEELVASDPLKPTNNSLRPALLIAIDVANPQKLLAAAAGKVAQNNQSSATLGDWLKPLGLGPLARITAEDPNTVLQEAVAAVRCVWPEVE